MAETTNEVVLKVAGISKRFGGLQALSDVGITIGRGQVYGLIGPNGAGKTTFFNVITGLYTPDSGTFQLAGKPYEPTAVHEVAKAGIARTFQNIRLFAEMTALENVMVGRHIRTQSGLIGAVFRTKAFKEEEAAIAKRAQELLDYVGIGKYADFKARTLSYGDQRRLEIARALATDPQLIALDEPPTFPGGAAAYRAYLRDNLHYPALARDQGIAGAVLVGFVVDEQGRILDPQVAKGCDGLNEEALRLVGRMPWWLPARRAGQPVRATFYLRIRFALQ